MLKKLDYTYPYHQSIGFYFDYSGLYDSEFLGIFKKLPIKYDFYLDNKMEDLSYSKQWRIYYPSNL